MSLSFPNKNKARNVFSDQVGAYMGAFVSSFILHLQRNMHRTITRQNMVQLGGTKP